MIELAILGLLDDQDHHGYELRKRLAELPGTQLTVSFGSLYPALGRLERAGHVKAVTGSPTTLTPVAPMSGSLAGELAAFRRARVEAEADRRAGRPNSRGKKVYGITDSGRERLHLLLCELDVSDDRAFALRVAFCDRLTPGERLGLFERRRAELVARRSHRRRAARSHAPTNSYVRSLLERDIQAITADLEWLDRMIDAERAAIGDENGGHE